MSRKDSFVSILTEAFDIGKFLQFSKDFFNEIEVNDSRFVILDDKRQQSDWNWTNFTYHIEGYYNIGSFIGSDKKRIAVYAVALKDEKQIDTARSMQRNFVKKLIESDRKDAAIVAFYADDKSNHNVVKKEKDTKWRLSFVRLDYEFAKGKVNENLTPAKRFSYLVGKGEPSHTAQERLFPIFDNTNSNPTLDEIEEAFSVEKVTKEFFEKYKEKYFQVKENLEENEDFINEAERHNFTSEQFAKKLMGQLAFLYFVQKKGWLGVKAIPQTLTAQERKNAYYNSKVSKAIIPKVYAEQEDGSYKLNVAELKKLNEDEEKELSVAVKGKPWGTGPKDFMRSLYNDCIKKGENFFDDYLEPLFYEGLNQHRGNTGFFPKLHCRIPFLNGGLFEPLDNYDWNHNDFHIDNELFSNEDKKGKREADGILDIFDRYNFTMNEDEPLEREVAIDPEMLGKIFENLLDAKDRKSKGAFYTPREIVHYMCQESIANYLVNETGMDYEDIKDFIIYGEFMKDEDTSYTARNSGADMLIPARLLDKKSGVNRLPEIDKALANIRVADPAVGSGAFPLGMISE
ncbi:MAG: hypothetical protein ACRCUS_09875, partial [Anaerovoracaceae bacterium]